MVKQQGALKIDWESRKTKFANTSPSINRLQAHRALNVLKVTNWGYANHRVMSRKLGEGRYYTRLSTSTGILCTAYHNS